MERHRYKTKEYNYAKKRVGNMQGVSESASSVVIGATFAFSVPRSRTAVDEVGERWRGLEREVYLARSVKQARPRVAR